MPVTILVGVQWGDEGKGKAIDLLSRQSDFVVRCQRGSNAGHTIRAGGHLLKLRLVPSSILHASVTPIIGDGMVVDPGCMKCMDCVSVCPNDALYFGFGPLPIGLKGGTGPSVALAGAGAGTNNELKQTIQATIQNSSSVTTTNSGNIVLSAD